jgi:hypothetical protein
MVRDGTLRIGEDHPNSKITAKIAREILDLCEEQASTSQISQKLGVTTNIVRHIKSGQSWRSERTDEEKKAVPMPYERNREWSLSVEDARKYEEKTRARIEASVIKDNKGHWLWNKALNINGYGIQSFRGSMWLAHRVSYVVFHGEIRECQMIRHRCTHKNCVAPECLEIGTATENAADRVRDGTDHIGARNPRTILTEDEARSIKASKGIGTQKDRAKRYNTTIGVVSGIDTNATWKHI